jgi:predicted nucleotide-binding protein
VKQSSGHLGFLARFGPRIAEISHRNAAAITADDLGSDKAKSNELQPRARQNVILELGFFIGKLGRDRVCALYENGVELPSDFSGVVYVALSSAWEFALAKEIRAAGIEIDLNRL